MQRDGNALPRLTGKSYGDSFLYIIGRELSAEVWEGKDCVLV
jgi:hypothetical protein